jgi:lysophospholipase L1-like esterase
LTGIKAWHTRSSTRFFTHSHWQVALERIQAGATILFSAGEIDCREGLGGPQLEGYTSETAALVASHVRRTVAAYVQALRETAARADRQVLVLPVAPHGQRRTGRVTSQQSRRATMWAWNQELRRSLAACSIEEEDEQRVFFLDYFEQLVRTGEDPATTGTAEDFVLNPLYQADGTHMNSGFAALLGDAIRQSGCDLSRL